MCVTFSAMTTAHVDFILVPRFSMIALFGAMEPMRVANRFAGPVFSWWFVSADGQPVAASNEIPVSVSGDLKSITHPTMAVVCASYEPSRGATKPMLATIRRLARDKVLLAGIDTGPFLLAEAGVLDGHRATCHWEGLPGFRESFPEVQVRQSLYEVDRRRMTSAGGAAAIDMMLAWIADLLGRSLAITVADQLLHFRLSGHEEEARAPATERYGTDDRRLLSIIAAMEVHMEEPLDAAALAEIGGLSERHMERLFRLRLKQRPMGVYQRLRLERAERLLNYSTISVRDAAVATGFASLAQFSRAFKARFGKTPLSVKQRRAAP
jgi:AraC family carnitine catabolism transcriptional activator